MKQDIVSIERLDVAAYTIPTESAEADGTFAWNATTLVLVQVHGGGCFGLGYSYADPSTAAFIRWHFADLVIGSDVFAHTATWIAMVRRVRNFGRPGVASMAISAVDTALWDLKARLLDRPLVALLGRARDAIAVYGSGGFTSYSDAQLAHQLSNWIDAGICCVKMKVGRDTDTDLHRVEVARAAIGPNAGLFVDANGAYTRKQALVFAERFADYNVAWFEEPVSSDDLSGLRLLRDRAPACMDISAGEYGYDLPYFRRLLDAEAVDVLQADATRCAGISGFLRVAALCNASAVPLSSHCAPALHVHPCCAVDGAVHVEYFFDHVRIERMLFDGAPMPLEGVLRPDPVRPGIGLEFKQADAERYLV